MPPTLPLALDMQLQAIGTWLGLVNEETLRPQGPDDPPVPGGQTADPAACAKSEPVPPAAVVNSQYERSYHIPAESIGKELLPFSNLPSSRRYAVGWHQLESPEGRTYFWNEKRNLYTNIFLFREDVLPEDTEDTKPETNKDITSLEALADELRGRYPNQKKTLPEYSDLVIDLLGSGRWVYYFADTTQKSIFWVDKVQVEDVVGDSYRYVQSGTHLDLLLETQYWEHIEMFPQHREITSEMCDKILHILRFCYHDCKTSVASTSPLDHDKIKEIIESVQGMQPAKDSAEDAWIIARHMSTFMRERFLHHHGQRGARLSRQQSVHKKVNRPHTYLFLLISPLLFYMPDVYIKKLDEMCIDGMVNDRPWNKFWNEMRDDWTRAFTPVTVLLSTNVGFLAIQSVDGSAAGPHRSVAQIASYVSTMASLGSYMTWYILSRQHPPGTQSTAAEAIRYLGRRTSNRMGLETDAIIYSLPTALFTWSIVAFLVAVCFITLNNSDTVTRTVISIMLVTMAVAVGMVVHTDWGSIAPSPDSLRKRTQRALLTLLMGLRRAIIAALPEAAKKHDASQPCGTLQLSARTPPQTVDQNAIRAVPPNATRTITPSRADIALQQNVC